VEICPRRAGHLDPLAAAIAESHESDRWPPHWPDLSGGFDVARYLTPRAETVAFVAVDRGTAVGHVALHSTAAPAVMDLASKSLGQPRERLAFVARMYVVRTSRRQGVAARLLERVAAHAAALASTAVLDVWEQLTPANSLYEASGWRALGKVTVPFGSTCSSLCAHSGGSISSVVRVAPDTARPAQGDSSESTSLPWAGAKLREHGGANSG
jgi:GNAT superfamily N-acetyltransferase